MTSKNKLLTILSDAEQFALAGFLAGHRGVTRDVYALDLRQVCVVRPARPAPVRGPSG